MTDTLTETQQEYWNKVWKIFLDETEKNLNLSLSGLPEQARIFNVKSQLNTFILLEEVFRSLFLAGIQCQIMIDSEENK